MEKLGLNMVNCISFARLHCPDLKAQCGFFCGLDRASSGCLYRLGLRALLSGEKDEVAAGSM